MTKPSLLDSYVIDYGSVVGRLHIDKHMNNQDSVVVKANHNTIVAVVADGCSASPHSEVGAYLTTNYIANQLLRYIDIWNTEKTRVAMEEIRLDTASMLRNIASQIGPTYFGMSDAFLSTAVGTLITQDYCFVFSLGDSLAWKNGKPVVEPPDLPYPGMVIYGGMSQDSLKTEPEEFRVFTEDRLPDSIVLASDGIEYLLDSQEQVYPGTQTLVPNTIEQLLECEDIQSVLRKAAKTVYRAKHDHYLDVTTQRVEKGLLLDDTTVVRIRRRQD